jgi:hypothetical protein
MRWIVVGLMLQSGLSTCQDGVNFEELTGSSEGDETTTTEDNVGLRLGLLANTLGVDPLASSSSTSGGKPSGQNLPFTTQPQLQEQQQQQAGGRSSQQCCCMSLAEQCGDALGRVDVSGGGLIDPRVRAPEESSISIRIVNRPVPNNKEEINSCPAGLKACCYDAGIRYLL